MEPVSKIDKRGDLNKRGGRKIFLKSINGEALIRVSRVEKISDNNKRASPFIRKVRVAPMPTGESQNVTNKSVLGVDPWGPGCSRT